MRASVSEELAAGELVPVLADHPLPAVRVQILHAFARAVPSRANVLFRFLETELIREDMITKAPTSQPDFAAAQQAFNQWSAESGRDPQR